MSKPRASSSELSRFQEVGQGGHGSVLLTYDHVTEDGSDWLRKEQFSDEVDRVMVASDERGVALTVDG